MKHFLVLNTPAGSYLFHVINKNQYIKVLIHSKQKKKNTCQKFQKIHRKKPVPEPLF